MGLRYVEGGRGVWKRSERSKLRLLVIDAATNSRNGSRLGERPNNAHLLRVLEEIKIPQC